MPKGTPTPCPSDVDVICEEPAPPPRRALSRRVAAGAGLLVLVVGGLALRAWGLHTPASLEIEDPPRTSAVADSVSAAPSDAPRGTLPLSAASPPHPAQSAPQGTVAPEPSAAPVHPMIPGKVRRPRKRNSVLGI